MVLDNSSPSSVAYHLSSSEIELVRKCFKVVLEGPWLARLGEIHTRMGLEVEEVSDIANNWPRGAETADQVEAVAGALREVGLGIRFTEKEWIEWVGVPREEVRRLFYKIRNLQRDSIVQGWPE